METDTRGEMHLISLRRHGMIIPTLNGSLCGHTVLLLYYLMLNSILYQITHGNYAVAYMRYRGIWSSRQNRLCHTAIKPLYLLHRMLWTVLQTLTARMTPCFSQSMTATEVRSNDRKMISFNSFHSVSFDLYVTRCRSGRILCQKLACFHKTGMFNPFIPTSVNLWLWSQKELSLFNHMKLTNWRLGAVFLSEYV